MIPNSTAPVESNLSLPLADLPIYLDSEVFNLSCSNFFDFSPPPGGPGGADSPLFDSPILDFLLSLYKKSESSVDLKNKTVTSGKHDAFNIYDVLDQAIKNPVIPFQSYWVFGAQESRFSPPQERIRHTWEEILDLKLEGLDDSGPPIQGVLGDLDLTAVDPTGETLLVALIRRGRYKDFEHLIGLEKVDWRSAARHIVENKKITVFNVLVRKFKTQRAKYKQLLEFTQKLSKENKDPAFGLLSEFLISDAQLHWFDREVNTVFNDAFVWGLDSKKIQFTTEEERLAYFKTLIQSSVNLNQKLKNCSMLPVVLAILTDSLDLIKLLVGSGARLGGEALGALMQRASQKDNLETNYFAFTSLTSSKPERKMISVLKDVEVGEILDYFLSQKINLNAYIPVFDQRDRAHFALGLAIQEMAPIPFLQRLISSGANLEAEDRMSKNNYTPLLAAISERSQDKQYYDQVIELLLSSGARIDHKTTDKDGYVHAPLTWAIALGEIDTALKLIELGADPNIHTPELGGGLCTTPLRAALHTNDQHHRAHLLVEALLRKGANPHDKGGANRTPLELAKLSTDGNKGKILEAFKRGMQKK